MSFKNPEYLLIIPVALFIFYLKLRQRPPAVRYSLAAYIKGIVKEIRWKKYFFLILRLAAVLLLTIALARPRKGLKERSVIKPAVDIMLVMDVSTSMRAIDFDPLNRMQAAVNAAKEFVSNRTSDRIGVVIFSGLPVLQCPLTMDNNAVMRLMDNISAGMINVDGTAIGMGISLGMKYLEKADSPSKVMILLTDGVNNTGEIDPVTAADIASSLNTKVYTIGAGKPGPAKVPVKHPYFGTRYMTIPDELDEDTLTHIAEKTGGKYFRATSHKRLKEIYAEIDRMEKKSIEVREYYEFEEKFLLFLFLGGLLLGLELIARLAGGMYL
ncbi:VWA domain-containing protein [Elusimicrobiota bacterium]